MSSTPTPQQAAAELAEDPLATARTFIATPELAETLAGVAAPSRQAEDQRGDELRKLGRYILYDVLGSGGMGVVYAAFDPKLNRRVAIKLLRAGTRGPSASERLLREAQAMAQLAHPNVVAIHDVGTVEDRVFLAMEFVPGVTLRAWLGAEPRAWQDVLTVIIDAGRGLAAAHAAGLVHRDFKPDNVMVRDDGRVQVMDFGLIWTDTSSESSAQTEIPEEVLQGRSSVELAELTRAGALMGTPGYMAPEQFASQPTDARTDQFAFCVTLYEVLYRQGPFEGASLPALALADVDDDGALELIVADHDGVIFVLRDR